VRRISQRLRLLVFSYSFSIVSPKGSKENRGSSKLRDGQRGWRRLCSVWIGVGEIEEAAGVYAETKIEELAETETRFDHPELAQTRKRMTRMKTIALIDTPIGGPRGMSGDPRFHTSRRDGRFRCQRRFPEAEASGRHIRTKNRHAKKSARRRPAPSRRTWPKANEPIPIRRTSFVVLWPLRESSNLTNPIGSDKEVWRANAV
jgi:hypothetical protein